MIEKLVAILGRSGVLVEEKDAAPYLTDILRIHHGEALAIVRPRNVGEVAQVIRNCSEHDVAVTAYGGGTGFCGGAIPAGGSSIILSLERMRRIRLVDPVNEAAIVEAGCTVADVQRAADEID